MIITDLFESPQTCPECGGPAFSDLILAEKKDACYYKVKASAKVWPSAYASGRLVQCRKKGADNYGKSKNEGVAEGRENYNGVNILFQKDDDEIFVKASAGGRELGHVLFVIDGEYLMPQDLEVEERFRGQGIAQTMYDYVKSKGYKIRRSGQQTDAGAGFWDKHKGQGQNVWEQGVAEGSNDTIYPNAEVIKSKNGKPVGEIYQDGNSWGAFHYRADRGYDFIDSREEAIEALKDLHQETGRSRPDYTIKGVAEKLGDNRPKLGSKRDAGKSVRKWRSARGLDETDQVNEKSVSQAQFRTMAAAAHNPEFAKKVGIKQSVAKEFHQADKGSNYKKLPDRTTEGAPVTTTPGSINPGGAVDNFKQQMANNTEVAYQKKLSGVGEGEQQKGADYRDPHEADYGDDYQDMVARVKKLAGLGPLKTVYDPAKRVYRNMPTAQQPKK